MHLPMSMAQDRRVGHCAWHSRRAIGSPPIRGRALVEQPRSVQDVLCPDAPIAHRFLQGPGLYPMIRPPTPAMP